MAEMVKERETEEMFLEGDDDENSQANKYLLFSIGEEAYGISIVSVTEIIEMQKITDVPDMPEYVRLNTLKPCPRCAPGWSDASRGDERFYGKSVLDGLDDLQREVNLAVRKYPRKPVK